MADTRMTAEQAGYMELQGARKDGDCRKVDVSGGVSLELGCCNEFEPKAPTVKRFQCEGCKYHKAKSMGSRMVKG